MIFLVIYINLKLEKYIISEAVIKFPGYPKIVKPLGKYDPTIKEEFID